jgi:hypothetical protein
MRVRYAAVTAVSIALGVLGGWAIGSTPATCEYSCPPQGAPCPLPPDCRHHTFNWTGGVVIGLLIALVVAALAALTLRRTGSN